MMDQVHLIILKLLKGKEETEMMVVLIIILIQILNLLMEELKVRVKIQVHKMEEKIQHLHKVWD